MLKKIVQVPEPLLTMWKADMESQLLLSTSTAPAIVAICGTEEQIGKARCYNRMGTHENREGLVEGKHRGHGHR